MRAKRLLWHAGWYLQARYNLTSDTMESIALAWAANIIAQKYDEVTANG